MKRFLLLMLIAVAAISFEDNFPVIRQFTYGPSAFRRYDTIEVRKFEDGLNVCYVATNSFANSDGAAPQPSISCVRK